MESDIFIEPGDVVSVSFHNTKFTLCSRAVVQHVPTATGDSWIFRDLETNQLHYVSERCTVTLIEKEIINKISISQFIQDYSGKMTKAMNEALISIRDNEHVKFIEDIEYNQFVRQQNIGKMAWERFVELREEAINKLRNEIR